MCWHQFVTAVNQNHDFLTPLECYLRKSFIWKLLKTPFLALCGVQLFSLCFWLSRLTKECSCNYSVHVFGCPVLQRNVHVIIQFMFLVVPSYKGMFMWLFSSCFWLSRLTKNAFIFPVLLFGLNSPPPIPPPPPCVF